MRSVRWAYYGRRQREILLGVAFGSSAIGVGTFRRRPVFADSGTFVGSKPWSSKSSADSRGGNQPEPKEQRSDSQRDDTSTKQTPPPPTRGHSTFETEGDVPEETTSAWQDATNRIAAVSDSFTGWDFAALRSKIQTTILPSWTQLLPEYADKLRDEFSGAPRSLSWEIWEEAHDPEINPEILWDAQVRISKELCADERTFLQQRLPYTTKALAKFLDVPESEIHPDDVPVIGVCGSGGGLRALVAGASTSLCAQEAGLLDCATYSAGVSGSCWLQALYYSSIGRQDHARIIEHLKQRIGVHIAYPPAALGLLSRAPTNKFLLSGFVEKLRGVADAEFGVVDVYGLLLAGRLLVPKGELDVSDSDLKVSNQRHYVEGGKAPLPIYTAVRHEIPEHMKGHLTPSQSAWHNTKHYDWFQWFEWTPYEFFCEELECGIPTWAIGRKWDNGHTVWRENGLALPEMRVPLMMGIWGSAFCATLSHYYKEIRPVLKAAGLSKLDSVLSGKDEDLVKVHPVDPSVIPNFTTGLRDRLPDTVPENVHEASHLQLMDAGMSNNLPVYPLLRPGRKVDVIVAFDASADVKQDNWPKVVDGYVRQRGITGWPMGAGWPPRSNEESQNVQQLAEAQAVSSQSISEISEDSERLKSDEEELGYCNIWVGTTSERQEYMDEPPSKRVKTMEDESHISSPDAGITFIYLPFLPNEKVPGVDPMKSDFMSTWNFIYTPEEIDKVVSLAKANFEEGKEQTKRAIKAVWERKRMIRLQREKEDQEAQQKFRRRKVGEAMVRDHFSGD